MEVHSQEILEWADFTKGISWQSETDLAIFREAVFSPELIALEGKTVVVVGYFLVLDGKQSIYMLSKNPMASCFFCGNGGPETIIELEFAEKPAFKMDDLLSVSGILQLNRNNPNHCYYRLEKAEALSL
ncbi:MAG: hypothetical protein AB3N18_13745 [Allomuricauda sp.]